MSGHLNPGGQQFRDDDGAVDPQVAAALAAYQGGLGSEQAALAVLAAARLLVPVVAVLADGSAAPGDKNSEMMLPTLIGQDGRPAVLAFTGLGPLARWRPSARPVPAEASRVWRAAAADGCAVVIDVAGPVPLAVEGARLAALAAGQPVPPAHEDPDVRAEVEAAVAAEPVIAGFGLAPSEQADLAVRLRAAVDHGAVGHGAAGDGAAGDGAAGDGAAGDWQPAVNRVARSIASRLGARLRRGIEISVTL